MDWGALTGSIAAILGGLIAGTAYLHRMQSKSESNLEQQISEVHTAFLEFKAEWPRQLNGTYLRTEVANERHNALVQRLDAMPKVLAGDEDFLRAIRRATCPIGSKHCAD